MKTLYTKEKWRYSKEYNLVTCSTVPIIEGNNIIATVNSNINWDETFQISDANGLLISCAPVLLQTCLNNYIFHQRKSKINVEYAIETDALRAELRIEISRAIGCEDMVFQNWIEHVCSIDQEKIGHITFT